MRKSFRKHTKKNRKHQRGGMKPVLMPEHRMFRDGFPAIGFGTACMPKVAIQTALETGYTCFDCAYNYHNSEAVVDAFLSRPITRSDRFVIGKGDTIQELDDQCDTVGGGYLDLALIHSSGSAGIFDDEELLTLWAYLSSHPSKFRHIGVSNMYIGRLKRFQKQIEAASLRPIQAIENELRPGIHDANLIHYCQQQRPPIHYIAYSTLRIHTAYKDFLQELKAAFPSISSYTSSDISLKWVLQQGATVIPSSRNPEHIRVNMSVLDKPDLPTEVMEMLYKFTTDRYISKGFQAENEHYWSQLESL